MTTETNADQLEYWNTVAGPRWVGLAGFVEKRVQKVNDLLLRRSAIKPGEKVLEVGCGTGAATVPLAEAVGGTGEVVGSGSRRAGCATSRCCGRTRKFMPSSPTAST